MNKSELVTLLREPGKLSSKQIDEIQSIVDENPYFLSARLLLAKASREAKHPQTKKRIASAAVYSTDRALLKKYLSGNLFFLSKPEVKPERKKVVTASQDAKKEKKATKSKPSQVRAPETKPSTPRTKVKESAIEIPAVPKGDLDAILEELKQDMENLKSSRAHFVEVQENIQEESDVAAIKEIVEKEIEAEVNLAEVENQDTDEVEKPSVDKSEDSKAQEDVPQPKQEAEVKTKEETQDVPQPKKATEVKSKEDTKEDVETKEEKKKVSIKKSTTKKTSTKKVAAKKVSPEEEDEIVSQKLAELAKKVELKKEDKEEKKEEITSSASAESTAEVQPKEEHAESENKKEVKEEIKPEEEKPKEANKVGDSSEKENEKTEDQDINERAEDPFRESRFDKDATRSYLKKLETPEDFPPFDTDDEDEVPAISKSENIEPKEEPTKAESPADPVEDKAEASLGDAEEKSKPTQEKQPEATVKKVNTPEEESKPQETTKEASPAKSSSVMPKGSIMKKAKLVKSKRSSRRKGSSGEPKLPKSEKGNDDDGKSDTADQQKIIDKFIKESPTIKYSQGAEPTAADLAQDSGTWDKNLASEYLAEIYLKQGNKKRAIEIYEVLSLKYPEKKSYFADLISKSK